MDIQYLLTLQDYRNSISDALTPFMEFISDFATTWLILIPVFIYWCWDKRGGLYTLVSYYFCMLLTPLIKLTACVYRPWVRDAKILPAGDAITTATGYSFPSGHTTTAGPLAGGTAVSFWKNKYTRWASALLVLFVLLTAFSRNYLGVHTPQDVFVAIVLSVLSLIFTAKLFDYLAAHPEKEDLFLLIGFVVCWAGIVYITFKGYPRDLNPDGSLRVDPQKMMNDGYGDIGKVLGFIIARYVEKRWIRFKPAGLNWKGILLCLLGLVPMALMRQFLRTPINQLLGSHWGKLTYSVIHCFYYIALFPLLLKACARWTQGQANNPIKA